MDEPEEAAATAAARNSGGGSKLFRLIDIITQILYILTAPRKKKISCGIHNRIRCQSECK